MKASSRKLKGLTLIETLLALAVSALVVMGAVIYYASIRQTADETKIVNDMSAIVSAYKAYVTQGNILVLHGNNGVTMGTLQDQGLLPNPLNDPWGQSYVSSSCNPNGNSEIAIEIQSLAADDKICDAVKSAVTGSAKPIGPSDCINAPSCGFVYAF